MIPNNYHELNYSKIATYTFCPFLYKLKYIEGKREGLVPVTSLGVSIHRTLEEYHTSSNNPESLLVYYNRCFLGAGYSSAAEQMEYYLKGKRIIEDYAKREKDRKSEILGCEKEFIFEHHGWKFRGKIDRFEKLPDGTYHVIDYKTDAKINENFDVTKSLQLALYIIGAKRAWGKTQGKASIYFVALNKIFSIPFEKVNEDEVLEKYIEIGEKLEGNDFPPCTKSCTQCLMHMRCPHSIHPERYIKSDEIR
ncbi:MAG: PD-(D/E)XK nuclease family protein [Elusimicrobiaceae bacterium]|nr:PD-(D/E)XK nuclease family protein [Elusimicrobiaceae bacterium]